MKVKEKIKPQLLEKLKQAEKKRKRAKEMLQESEERYRVLVESSNQAVFTVDKSGLFLFMNTSAARRLGGKPKDFCGKTMRDLFPKEIANRQMANIRKAMETASQLIVESESFIKGEQRWFETNIQPTRNSSGVFDKVLCVAADITERKRMEEALQVEKAYLERLFESVQEAIVVTDNNGLVLRTNSEFTRLFGYTQDEAVGHSVDELVAPNQQHREATDLTEQVLQNANVSLETVRWRKDGTPIHVSILGSPVIIRGEQVGMYGVYRDITERKRIEEERKKKHEELERFNKLAVDRELKMIELKREINVLLEKLGKVSRYEIPEESMAEVTK